MTAPLQYIHYKNTRTKICLDFLQTVQSNHLLEKDLMPWADTNQEDTFGFTALYWAISHHNMHNLKLLIAYGATLKVTSSMNALFYAIDCDNLEALKYFIDKGIDKDIVYTRSYDQTYTLYAYAKKRDRKVILEYLN
ncbi:MAG: hypothetical protein COB07_04310 [Sulfurovum sp.]|nr:MAG: hypothetical protein COB07_04310 [Sulfurovum sp.]